MREVNTYKHEGKVLVDFYLETCGPCKFIRPLLKNHSGYKGIEFVAFNLTHDKTAAAELNIYSVPTLILFEDGVELKRRSGMIN